MHDNICVDVPPEDSASVVGIEEGLVSAATAAKKCLKKMGAPQPGSGLSLFGCRVRRGRTTLELLEDVDAYGRSMRQSERRLFEIGLHDDGNGNGQIGWDHSGGDHGESYKNFDEAVERAGGVRSGYAYARRSISRSFVF